MHSAWVCLAACAGLCAAAFAAAVPAQAPEDPFAPFESLAPPVTVPKGPVVTVDGAGNYVLGGRPRFLLGAQVPEAINAGLEHTAGYPDALKWLYEQPLRYETAQRAGFDTVGYFTPPGWMTELYGPDATDWWHKRNEEDLGRFISAIGLPLYVDYTCAPWAHGMLTGGDRIPAEARNAGGSEATFNHWVPYSATHPEGVKLYRAMWAYGAKHALANRGRPLFYELFNEPAYDDPSAYNRGLFVQRLQRLYGTTEQLNAAWGTRYGSFEDVGRFKDRTDNPALFVEWCKFMEDAFADLCREGVATIRAVDPGAHCCVQVMGSDLYRALPKSNANLYKLSQFLDAPSTCTGGGVSGGAGLSAPPEHAVRAPSVNEGLIEGILHRHFMRSISRGKAIHDGEAYMGTSRDSLMDMLWLELARGGNAAYLFIWDKRSWDPDWGPDKSAAGGQRVAEKFPYLILDPYAVPTQALTGVMDFKREMLKVDDLFCDRSARAAAKVAVLLSYPTERYAQAVAEPAHDAIRSYAAAIELSHYPLDVILEEQLAEGRQDEYGVIVAAGVTNVYAQTLPLLRQYVQNGGVLVLGLEAMQMDECGRPSGSRDLLGLELGEPAQAPVGTLDLALPQPELLPGPIRAAPYRGVAAGPEWTAVASLSSRPVLLVRGYGRGRVYYVGARMPDYALAAVLGAVLKKEGLEPACRLARVEDGELAVNVEVHKAAAGGLTAWFLRNWDRYPKVVRFGAPELAAPGAALVGPLDGLDCEVTGGQAVLMLPPQGHRVIVAGGREALAARFGPTKRVARADAERAAQEARAPGGQAPLIEENVERVPLYQDGLLPSWGTGQWGGVGVREVTEGARGGSRAALLFALEEKATDWCGGLIATSRPPADADAEPALTPEMRRDGFLAFYVNGSVDRWGTHRGEQHVQVQVKYRMPGEAEWHSGPFIGADQYLAGGVVDDDPASWQKVRIPLRWLIPDERADRVGAVVVQYQGTPPAAGLVVDSIALERPKGPPGL